MKPPIDDMQFAEMTVQFRTAAKAGQPVHFDADQVKALLRRGFLPWLAGQETYELLKREMDAKEQDSFRPAAYSPSSLAQRWGVSATQIHSLLKSGKLPGFKLGETLWRVKAETVDKYEQGEIDPWT